MFLDYCAFLWGRPDDTRVSAPQSALAETDGNFISAAAAAAATAVQPLKHSTTFSSSVSQKQMKESECELKFPSRFPPETTVYTVLDQRLNEAKSTNRG